MSSLDVEEVEALEEAAVEADECSTEVGCLTILSTSTKNPNRVSTKNLKTPSIMTIDDVAEHNVDKTVDSNAGCELRDSKKLQTQELERDLELKSDNEIVYRMPRIFTREESQSRKVSGSGLLSHLIHGVDNTGDNGSMFCVFCSFYLFRSLDYTKFRLSIIFTTSLSYACFLFYFIWPFS